MTRPLQITIVTCSDTRSMAEDTAGAVLAEECDRLGWTLVQRVLVVDDLESISAEIVRFADTTDTDVILTCGGTGLGPRDVTPEATKDVCEREVPGIAEAIRAGSMQVTGRAMLSRATAGLRGTTLVINLPGSRKAAIECFGFISDQLEHAVEMAHGGSH